MLARNFKTADELGLTDLQHDALIQVLGKLERGELYEMEVLDDDIKTNPNAFSMKRWSCCICGHAGRINSEAFGVNKYGQYVGEVPRALTRLFTSTHYDLSDARDALRDYLVSGG